SVPSTLARSAELHKPVFPPLYAPPLRAGEAAAVPPPACDRSASPSLAAGHARPPLRRAVGPDAGALPPPVAPRAPAPPARRSTGDIDQLIASQAALFDQIQHRQEKLPVL